VAFFLFLSSFFRSDFAWFAALGVCGGLAFDLLMLFTHLLTTTAAADDDEAACISTVFFSIFSVSFFVFLFFLVGVCGLFFRGFVRGEWFRAFCGFERGGMICGMIW
jgi:hypothetical protein